MIDKNLDHERALYAFECVTNVKNFHDDFKDKYRSAVLSSGILIHKSGLMQTLSFYIGKKNDKHYRKLATDILNWREIYGGNDEPLVAYHKLLILPDDEIIQKTQEAKALIIWLKNFADAMFKKEK